MDGAVLRKVRLFGHLAEGVGREIELAFGNPVQALRLLEVNFPGFMRRFREGFYHVRVVRSDGRVRALRPEQLDMRFDGDLHIIPAAVGANSNRKKGLLGVILGAILIGAAFFFTAGLAGGLGTVLPGFLGATGATFGTIAQLGLGLALNGVAMMLTPTPSTNYSEVDERRSFMFNGPTNLSEQGGVVPVVFGTMMIGTTTVSASLDSEILHGSAIGGQRALNSRHSIRRAGTAIRLYFGDIAHIETGTVLTKINGTAVTGDGTLNIPALELSVKHSTTGSGTGIPGFPLGSISGFKNPAMEITYTGAGNPAALALEKVLSFEVSHASVLYTGQVVVEVGFPAKNETFLKVLAGTGTGGFLTNPNDATGS